MQRWQYCRPLCTVRRWHSRHVYDTQRACQAAVRYRSDGTTATPSSPRHPPITIHQDIDRARESRHLLRGLLRECTYLPDSFVRQWMRGYVRARFERYGEKASMLRHDPAYDQRERSKSHEARQGLGTLRRANEGERKPLLKILLMAYGRTGKRRHELMLPLMPKGSSPAGETILNTSSRSLMEAMKDGSQEQSTTPASSGRGPGAAQVNRGAWSAYVPDFTPQMRALLESSIQSPPPHLTRPVLRRLQPRIEEHNAWHRPMPLVRVKTQTKAWYAGVLERTHPPLPTAEWKRLFDLATGRKREAFIPRRTPAGPARQSALEMAVLYGKTSPRLVFGNREAHQLTPRYMRHLWSQVFAQCSVMQWDSGTLSWKVTWGEQALLDHASLGGKQLPSTPATPVDEVAVSNRNA